MASDGPGEGAGRGRRRRRGVRRTGLGVITQRLGWAAAARWRRARVDIGWFFGREIWAGVFGGVFGGIFGDVWRRGWEAARPVARPLILIGLLVNAVWLGAALFIAYLWPAAFSPIIDRGAFAGFERAADRARGVALVDGRGRRFGVMSGEFDRDHLGELPNSLFFSGLEVHPDHKSIPVEDAPPHFWRCLAWLEDKGRGGWDNPFGVSFTGVFRIPYSMGARLLTGADPFGAPGGSTLEMQLARSMWKRYRHNSHPLIRKIREWRAAPVLNRALARGEIAGDGRRFRAWIASHVALVRGVGGDQGSLYGVETSARYLFGTSAGDLSAAQQLILAAAARRPIRLRETEAQRRRALAALAGSEDRPGRAMRCASPEAVLDGAPVIPDPAARRRARRDLLALADAPYDGPFVDPALAPFLSDMIAFPGGPRLEPQAVSRRLALPLQAELAAELADRYAAAPGADRARHLWRGRLTELRTTVDVAASKRLLSAAQAALRKATRGLRQGETPRLAPKAFSADRAPLLLMAMDLDGRILRYAQTGFDSVALGGAATRPDWGAFGDGPHDPTLRSLPIGSLGKIGAALLLAEAGATDLARRVSNRCQPGLFSRCMRPSDWSGGVPSATPEEVFGRSLNAATIRALGQAGVTPARISTLLKRIGLSASGEGVEDAAATRLALGRIPGRPAEALKLMAAALAYAEGDFDRPIPQPRFVASVTPFDPLAERAAPGEAAPALAAPVPLRAVVKPGPAPEKSSIFVRRVLQAPLCFKRERAQPTLRRLRAWCASARPDLRLHLAKTGTIGVGGVTAVEDGSFDEGAWWVAGAVRIADGRAFVYVALAGDGSSNRPFARRLGAGALAPAIDVLLRDLIAAPQRS